MPFADIKTFHPPEHTQQYRRASALNDPKAKDKCVDADTDALN
jgi:hypothetical protein